MKKSVGSFVALNRRGILLLGVVLSLAVFAIATWRTSAQKGDADSNNFTGLQNVDSPAARAEAQAAYGKIGMSFEANQGQTDEQVNFLARGSGYTLFLTQTEAVFVLARKYAEPTSGRADTDALGGGVTTSSLISDSPSRDASPPAVLRMKLEGANNAPTVSGMDRLQGTVNYLTGNDPDRWHADIPTFGRVHYEGVYEGVDLVYYGNQQQLEYDFIVAPGADHNQVNLSFEGANKVEVDPATGDLLLMIGRETLRQLKPVVYQEVNGLRREIESGYVKKGGRRVGFAVGAYDTSRALIIDPVLAYSTYLGGSGNDTGGAIKVDATGNAFIVGTTGSANFPTLNATQATFGGGTCGTAPNTFPCNDVFVTKLNAAGTALIYSTYLGGSNADTGRGIAIDASGNTYVTGNTASTNFPTANAFQSTFGGGTDAFVAKLNAAGTTLLYSTYLGGSGNENNHVTGIAVDSSGNSYLSGSTSSTNFPTTAGAFQTTLSGAPDLFVTKLNTTGLSLLYSTYLGGNGSDLGLEIAIDSGNAYITGQTTSTNFPTTAGAFSTVSGGGTEVFVTKVNPTGTTLIYSTYLGGGGSEAGLDIAVDPSGNAYVTGQTTTNNFPTTAGAFQTTFGGGAVFDGFVTKLSPTGSTLVYSTYLGGNDFDFSTGIAVDSLGNAYLTGITGSTNFPTTPDAYQTTLGAGTCGAGICDDVFVTKLNAAGSALLYSTFHGGASTETGNEIAIDASGNAYVTGFTSSTNFPTTNALQTTNGGGQDAFVLKIRDLVNTVSISGIVSYGTTPVGQPAKFVPRVLLTAAGSIPLNATTNSSGAYLLSGLGSGAYTVTPSKSGDVNGISALDAALVAQHAAELIVLLPNQLIAGDATNNGTLSALDAARIAQTAAGITNPGIAGQWKFVPALRNYASVPNSLSNENYQAILVGDVTGNWAPPASRTIDDKELAAWNMVDPVNWDTLFGKPSTKSDVIDVHLPVDAGAPPGTVVTIPISIAGSTGKGVVAYEFTLNFDPNVLSPTLDAVNTVGTLSHGWSVTVNSETSGQITVTAYSTEELRGAGTLLDLNFAVIGARGITTPFKWTRFQLNENEVLSIRNSVY